MTRRTSEDSSTTVQQDITSEQATTALPKGSTSQESMSMFPTSNGSKELTTMPQVGYDTADSTMFRDGSFSAQDMMLPASQMMPPYFAPTNQDWQTVYSLLGYDANHPLEFASEVSLAIAPAYCDGGGTEPTINRDEVSPTSKTKAQPGIIA
ncbi:hypothetical protein FPHYL_12964 [Fusarium phyllophilum]|uniref:Uncharacterized protein n=1 Tax=Fusarium phyllophilum TaxID=47803 RepID=A0A8H5IG99_9HYPO|nr:hypothetical protein FPHYL_12964 [Fusarium phyllophilum]